jgi:hypothetical protein
VGVKSGLYGAASAYRRISRYFFYALLVVGLLGTVTGVFAQTQNSQQINLKLSNYAVTGVALHQTGFVYVNGTVSVSGPWSGGPLHFGGVAVVTGSWRGQSSTFNVTIASNDFNPSSLDYPAQTGSDFSANKQTLYTTIGSYEMTVNAYDANDNLVGSVTVGGAGGRGNLFILTMELPLFQVPALGISATSPDFSSLFATFDQMPLGDFYMLLAEVAIIFLMGAGIVNFILYLTGGGEGKNQTKTLAGLNNIMITLLAILLLPYAYNAIAGFVNVLDQQIVAGPGAPYTTYSQNINLVWNTLPTGGNILTDLIGAIASLMAWVMSWLLGSARLFLIGAVIVVMPIVLVLKDVSFTARFAGTIEDTFFGLIFASIMSALFIGLAANLFNHWGGSIFQAAAIDKTWVALAALLGAILIPTVFAPLTGIFFQTMSQVGMAAAGTALAIGAGGVGPASAGAAGGISAAGQAVSGLGSGAGFAQKAGAALGGFGGAFGRAVPHMAQNMALMGTVGTLGGLGASRSASAINRAIEFKTPAQTNQNILTYRAGMLTKELDLSEEVKPHIARAFGVGVRHDEIREVDALYHNNLDDFRKDLENKIKLKMGKP